MIHRVYHAINPTFGFGDKPSFPDDYELVATVECAGLEDVFRITNTIDSAWTNNPEVVELHPTNRSGYRSTSVGDVVVVDGTTHYCDMVGWKEVEKI